MSNDRDNPLDAFKRATTATIRAIAANEEVEVSFGQGPATLSGNRIRVPLPTIGATEDEVNAVRGLGDELALKMRYHDPDLHRRRSPRSGVAQEMFQWIVQTFVLDASTGNSPLGRMLTDMHPQIAWWSLPVAFGISVGIGIVFGIYPARAAAYMDPIEALRHE